MAESGASRRGGASSNIYTVLVVIAFLVLAVAIGYVWVRSSSLFGGGNPFEVKVSQVVDLPATMLA